MDEEKLESERSIVKGKRQGKKMIRGDDTTQSWRRVAGEKRCELICKGFKCLDAQQRGETD